MTDLGGDQQVQEEVLEGLAEAVNHRKWFSSMAFPYLGDDPIEIGSGFGDYALEWAPRVRRFTCTEAEPHRLDELRARMAEEAANVEVRHMLLPSEETASHTGLVTYNVLEHIEDHVGALRSMSRLVLPGSALVIVVPAFMIAMSRVDIATGHVRRYTKKTMREAVLAAGLEIEVLRYANILGFFGYFVSAKLLGQAPRPGRIVRIYDRFVLPATRWWEGIFGAPFGQSVVCVARTPVSS
ncbi:class I SAM-dependent methyltransferase [Longispora albida]|uniref:class I SAM-dependent methyltransferase n=1 Tax=Longispora albida TaxID=203523 RepID=UPI000379F820|nr:class I SAM-dependent methyltransferase [Longispora albida]